MNDLNVLLAVAGVTVTLLVVAAMVLLTPRGTVPSRRGTSPDTSAAEPLAHVEHV